MWVPQFCATIYPHILCALYFHNECAYLLHTCVNIRPVASSKSGEDRIYGICGVADRRDVLVCDCESGYWTTRGYANSRTGRLADRSTRGCHRRLCVLSFRFWRHLRDRELSSPRVGVSSVTGSSKSELVEVIPNSVNRKRGYLREASYLLLCFV